jgi:hypothetical protein
MLQQSLIAVTERSAQISRKSRRSGSDNRTITKSSTTGTSVSAIVASLG